MGLFDRFKSKTKKSDEDKNIKTPDIKRDEFKAEHKSKPDELSEEQLDEVTGGPNQEYYDAINGKILDDNEER